MLFINLHFSNIAIWVATILIDSAYIVSIGSFVMVGELRAGISQRICIHVYAANSYTHIRIAIVLYNQVLKRVQVARYVVSYAVMWLYF